jgi:hypothetical protein
MELKFVRGWLDDRTCIFTTQNVDNYLIGPTSNVFAMRGKSNGYIHGYMDVQSEKKLYEVFNFVSEKLI